MHRGDQLDSPFHAPKFTIPHILHGSRKDLMKQFGRGFGQRTLRSPMLPSNPTLGGAFPLPWSAFARLPSIKNPHVRTF